MSKQFPLPSSTNHTTAMAFISTRFLHYPHLKIPQFRRDWKQTDCPARTHLCEHIVPLFPVEAVWCQVINLHHTTPTSGRPHQMQRPLSSEQQRDWINYLIAYCQTVMNFARGKDLLPTVNNEEKNVGKPPMTFFHVLAPFNVTQFE